MQISVLNVSIETKPTKTGKTYQQAEVAYKNLTFQGKVESKKLMSFGAQAEAFKTMTTAQAGQVYEVTVVKNDAGYNDWTSAMLSDGPQPHAAPSGTVYQPAPGTTYTPKAAASTPARSSYETPEERAQRQVFIIRQSNISSAINLLGTGAKAPPKLSEVLEIAKAFEDYVLGVKPPIDEPSGFEGMDSDIPL